MMGGDRREYGPVTEEQIRQWIAEGRANAETLVQAEGGLWKKLGTFPEFQEALDAASPPPASTPPPVTPPPSPIVPARLPVDPRKLVTPPAICLIVAALIDAAMALFSLLATAMGWSGDFLMHGPGRFRGGDPEVARWIELFFGPLSMGMHFVSLLLDAFVIVGALRMMSLKNYQLCLVVAVLAMVPCTAPCCCLGIAAGIWALIVLLKDEVKAAFG